MCVHAHDTKREREREKEETIEFGHLRAAHKLPQKQHHMVITRTNTNFDRSHKTKPRSGIREGGNEKTKHTHTKNKPLHELCTRVTITRTITIALHIHQPTHYTHEKKKHIKDTHKYTHTRAPTQKKN